jgi:hypothetical protein
MSHPRQKYAEMCRNRVFTIDRSGGALMVAFPAISRWLAGESLESEPESTLRADVVTFACTTAMCAVFFGAGAATWAAQKAAVLSTACLEAASRRPNWDDQESRLREFVNPRATW